MSFCSVYIPVGVPTYHLETAQDHFERSCAMLRGVDPDFVCPDEMLLTLDKLRAYLDGLNPDLIVFQNLTFANAAYMAEVLRRYDCPMLLWTLREPVIDGGRLRLNSLTGAYSAANTLAAFDGRAFNWCFGAPEEESVVSAVKATVEAARVKKAMRSLTMSAIGHTPQGFGFGRALDSELMNTFGVELESIEARELIDMAKTYTDEECAEYLRDTESCTCGLDKTPENNRNDHARLLKAYRDYVRTHHIGALASRCWPDFFTSFGTPVCTVLSMLNDEGVAAACEADIYGALSMWIGMQLSGEPVFFGDPVALDEAESSITYWHCGAAACSLARKDTGAVVGVHQPQDRSRHGLRLRSFPRGNHLPHRPQAGRQLPLLCGRGLRSGQAEAVHRHFHRGEDRPQQQRGCRGQHPLRLRAALCRHQGPSRRNPEGSGRDVRL